MKALVAEAKKVSALSQTSHKSLEDIEADVVSDIQMMDHAHETSFDGQPMSTIVTSVLKDLKGGRPEYAKVMPVSAKAI